MKSLATGDPGSEVEGVMMESRRGSTPRADAEAAVMFRLQSFMGVAFASFWTGGEPGRGNWCSYWSLSSPLANDCPQELIAMFTWVPFSAV
jgi:hypothetical protein